MLLPKPIEHRFTLDGEAYLLVEWTRGGERRFKTDYALAISQAPGVIEAMDGANLYAEAVARECLKEAPDLFWEPSSANATQNGATARRVTLEAVPRALWEAFRKEVDVFLGLIFPATPADAEAASGAGPDQSVAVAPAEAVSPVFRGRAE
jgi:hypothetical protein